MNKPDARLIGTQQCLETGDHDADQPTALIAGLDIRCWTNRPPWGGLAGGGESVARIETRGGLAGGGSSVFFQSAAGGLAGGGSSHARPMKGGLLAGLGKGGLAGGGKSHFQVTQGGLKGGGASDTYLRPMQLLQTKTGSAGGTTSANLSLAWPTTTKQGSLLVAAVSTRGTGNTVTAPAGWQIAYTGSRGTDPFRQTIFYLPNAAPQSSTGNFTVNASAGAKIAAVVVEVTDVLHTNPLDAAATNQGNGGTVQTAATGTLAQSNEIVIAGLCWTLASSATAPTNGFTIAGQVVDAVNVIDALLSYKIVSSNASTSTGVTVSAADWVFNIVSFRGA